MALFFRKRKRTPKHDVDVEPWKDHESVSRETYCTNPNGRQVPMATSLARLPVSSEGARNEIR